MARVLLVNPPFYRLLGSHYNGLALGLAYIAASLREAGHNAWVYNADYEEKAEYKTLHQIFETFNGFDRAPIHECIQQIQAFGPDVIGYTCYTAVIPVVDEISREIRLRLPGVVQIAGGPHITLDPDAPLRLPAIDNFVRGEGEEVMRGLMRGGHGLRTVVQSKRIAKLDNLPFPDREHFWANSGRDVCYVSTARGCPWRCHYCASPAIWPRVYSRSPYNVIREIRQLPIQFGASSVSGERLRISDNSCLYIIDDTFTFSEQRALAIIDGIAGLPWKCEARADTITEPLAKAMSDSGCLRVKMGIESGSERILKSINKGETKDDMRRAVRLLQDYCVPITLYLMAGFPGETDDDLRQTIAFARELQADYYSISMVAPYFGTRLYRDAVAAGLPVDRAPHEVFFHHNDSRLLNPTLSRELIEELWSLCDIQHYA